MGGGWSSSDIPNIVPGMGPGVLVPETVYGSQIANLEVNQVPTTGGVGQAYNLYYYWSSTAGIANDGFDIQGGKPSLKGIYTRGWLRHGILIDGTYQGTANFFGLAQPDYWDVSNYYADDNRGYGIEIVGLDSNGGALYGGNNDFTGNQLGALDDESEASGTYSSVNGQNNAELNIAAGTTQAISSLTVAGSGSSAVCTLVASAALAGNLQFVNLLGQNWITVAGTSVADGTWYSTSTNTGTETIVFPCALDRAVQPRLEQ